MYSTEESLSTAHTTFVTEGPIAILTFNRPEARNAMTWEMYRALVDACDRVDRDQAVRVFILRGAGGKAFVSGTDIAQFESFRAPADDIDHTVRELALQIASNAPLTIRSTKEMIRRLMAKRRLDVGADRDLIDMCYSSADFREGVASFLAKRKPQWRGR